VRIIKIDLNEIRLELGDHFGQVPAAEHIAYCDNCDEELTQLMDECPGCGLPVVWLHSKEWKSRFGTPGSRIKELSTIMPADNAGKYLMFKAGLSGFKEKAEADRWASLAATLGQRDLSEIINYCARKASGRGLVAYALNAAAKKAASISAERNAGMERLGRET
jgi:hypothetical protein